jgi:hypothetical protein
MKCTTLDLIVGKYPINYNENEEEPGKQSLLLWLYLDNDYFQPIKKTILLCL